MNNKKEDLILIAQKGGNDAHLLLLDKISALEQECKQKFEDHVLEMKETIQTINAKIEKIDDELTELKKTNEILARLLEEAKNPKDISAEISFI